MHISHDPWVWVGAFFTFAVLSFLYKDNIFYKFAEHVVVGVSVGYILAIDYFQAFLPYAWNPIIVDHRFVLIIPFFLGLLMYTLFIPQLRNYSWLARYPICLSMGIGIGMLIPPWIQLQFVRQIQGTLIPIGFTSWALICNLLILIGVFTGLVYFFFSKEHKGGFGVLATIGIYYLMVSFGANFGYTVMGRISLFIGRVQFLCGEWLGVLN